MTKVEKIPVLIKVAFMVEKAQEARGNKQSIMYVRRGRYSNRVRVCYLRKGDQGRLTS